MANGSSHQVPYLAWCEEHGKRAFTHERVKEVVRVMRRRGEKGIRRYPCGIVPNGFHVGHLPRVTREGIKTAREVYGR